MENEVVIHVRAEDDTAAGFAKARASAKKLGEQIERDLKESGTKGGKGLADGIGQGFESGHGSILGSASDLGDGITGILGDAGANAGGVLGQGIADGFDEHAPGTLAGATILGSDISDEMELAGKDAGEKLAKGIRDGLKSATKGEDGEELLPGAGKKGGKAGAKAGVGFVEAFGNILMGVAENPKIVGALGLVALSAAPLIGGTLGAAVVGGAAGVGIVGGFVAAVQHPQVKGAGKALGSMLKEDLKDASTSFVPSAIGAINTVAARWKGLLPEIRSIFSQSGDLAGPLLDGILDGVDGLVAGIDDALGNAGPVVKALGDAFAEVGEALGTLLTNAADDSHSWASALDFLTSIITGAIDTLTLFTEIAAFFIETVRPIGDIIGGVIDDIDGWVTSLADGAFATEETTSAQADLADKVDGTTASVQSQVEWMAALADEMKKQTDPLFNLITAQQDVTKAQTEYNKALDKHGPRSEEARDALVKLGKAATGMSGAAAAAARDGLGEVTPALRDVWRQAGLTEPQIRDLEKALRAAKGAANAWEGSFTQTYTVRRRVVGNAAGTDSGIGGFAHGGITGAANGSMSSGLTMVGESGPELVKLPAGTQVHSNPDTRRIAANGFGGRPDAPPPIAGRFVVDPSGSSKLMRVLLEALRLEINQQGGNVQTVLGVSRVG
jgi:ABC-type transporter Mla subunit MlaD